ncbi:MAG: succinate dehydrogenase cytochrome b subunit [Anaerolineae bacterium]|nr:succinate dehydrogenase cytochrome b subunit [Anaerolineae bacterium]
MSVRDLSIVALPQTTVGKKVIMALSGAIWIGYLLMHMYGNLKIFTGPEHFNEYAAGLRTLGAPIFGYANLLWVARIVLILSFVPHVWAGLVLYFRKRKSRGTTNYVQRKSLRAGPATLTMVFGGIAIGLFIIYHLLHFTFGVTGIHPDFRAHDAYHNVIIGFTSYAYIPAIIYLVGLVAVGFHLYHGAWSMWQTLGLNNKAYTGLWRGLAWLLALGIPLGFALIPIAVIFGIVS